MKKSLFAAAVVCCLAGPLRAAPLKFEEVPADVTWLIHLDVDALKATDTGDWLRKNWLSRENVQDGLTRFRDFFGMDLAEDLEGVTVFGRRLGQPGDGVALFRGKADQQRLLKLIEGLPDYESTGYAGHKLHRWTQNKDRPNERHVTGCFVGPSLVLVGDDRSQVETALDVLDGRLPPIAAGSPLAQKPPEGTVAFAVAVGLAEAELPFRSPLVRQSEQFRAAFGEYKGDVFVDAQIVAKTPELAEQLKSVVEGARAMAGLQAAADPQVAKALQALKVAIDEKDDKTLTLGWQLAADDFVELLQKAQAAAEKRRQAAEEEQEP